MRIWKGKARDYKYGQWRRSFHIGWTFLLYEEEVRATKLGVKDWGGGPRYRGVYLEFRPWKWHLGKVEFWHDGTHKALNMGPISFCWGD